MLTGEQIRAARALTRIDQVTLAAAAGLSLPTIKRLEASTGPISAKVRTAHAVEVALQDLGVIFIPENGEGPGVRLRKAAT